MICNHSIRGAFRAAAVAAIAVWFASATARSAETADDDLRINQLQVIGTHNSYHIRATGGPKAGVRAWNYSHAPLDVQLDRGVRSFELDLHYKHGEFEVFHVPVVDEGTTCRRLADALATVRKWSDAHPRHVPISFLFELKKEGPGLDPQIHEVDAAGLDHLDEVLRAGFAADRRIEPDLVRGTAATLAEAVRGAGWPTLAAARGKVFFILHDDDKVRALYTAGHPSLAGRAMFVRSDESRDDAAVMVMDNPRDPKIPGLARQGYYIRTRADSDLRANGQPARRDTALASGAQIVSTDYPTGEAQAETGYTVEFPGAAPARISPINGPDDRRGQTLAQ